VSSGNRELDSFIGGGIGLGTVLMFETDNVSNYGDTILSYGIVQAVSSGHRTIVVTKESCSPQEFAGSLPYNRNVGSSADMPSNLASEERGEALSGSTSKDSGDEAPLGLKIAWQYEKYIKEKLEASRTKSEASSDSFCCSYDLSKTLQPSVYESNLPVVISIEELSKSPSSERCEESLDEILSRVLTAVAAVIQNEGSADSEGSNYRPRLSQVHRIFIPHLAQIAAEYGYSQEGVMSVVRFILGVKQLLRETSVSATLAFTVDPQTCSDMLTHRLKWISDTVLSVETFAGRQSTVPYELAEYCGLLAVEKLQQVGAIASFRPSGSKFGLKRDARKLTVEPLHLPPEESRAFGDAGKCTPTPTAAKAAEQTTTQSLSSISGQTTSAGAGGYPAAEASPTVKSRPQHITLTKSADDPPLRAELKHERSYFNISIPPPSPELTSRVLEAAPKTPSKYDEKDASGRDSGHPINPRATAIFSRAKAQQTSHALTASAMHVQVQMPRPIGIAGIQSPRHSNPAQSRDSRQNKADSAGSLDF
jgi:elongator complex protein 4